MEVGEFVEDIEPEELIQTLHGYALAAKPTPYYEYLGVSCPAKFSAFLDDQGWEIDRIEKFGGFEKNELLTDKKIIEELRGSAGTNRQKYKKVFDSSSKSSFSQMKKDVKVCLQDNPIWRQHILNIIDEIEKLSEETTFDGKMDIYNLSNTVYSIHLTTTSGNPIAWQPNYYLLVEGDRFKRRYFGGLVPNGKTSSMKEILETFYNGNAFEFLFPMSWGGYESRDYKIASHLGLEYSSFRCIENENGKIFSKYNGYEFQQCSSIDPFAGYLEYLNKNPKLIQEINAFYKEHTPTPGLWFA